LTSQTKYGNDFKKEIIYLCTSQIVTICGRPPTVTFWRHRRNTNSTDSLHALRYGATQDSGAQKQNGGKMTKVMETIAKEVANL
jgi:hypothetical protein